MNLYRVLLSIILLTVVPSLGCKSRHNNSSSQNNGSNVEPERSPAKIALDAKLNAAISCINYVSKRVGVSRSQYFSAVDPDKGPDSKMTVYFNNVTDDRGDLAKLDKAIALTPAVPDLDTAMKNYRVVITDVMPLFNEAADYFQKKRNQDDDAVKGKQLHPKLLDGFDRFEAAAKAMTIVVDSKNRQRREEDLAMMAKDPASRGEYLVQHFLLLSEDVVKLGELQFDKLDLAVLTAKSAELEQAASEIKTYSTAQTKPEIRSASSLISAADYYVKAALALVRRKRDNKAFTDDEKRDMASGRGDHIEGSATELIMYYNRLIDTANSH
jgi:hypothetical protein